MIHFILYFLAWWTPAMLIVSGVMYMDEHKQLPGEPTHVYTIHDFWVSCGLGLLGWLIVAIAAAACIIHAGFILVEFLGRVVTRTKKGEQIDWKKFWNRPLIDHQRKTK